MGIHLPGLPGNHWPLRPLQEQPSRCSLARETGAGGGSGGRGCKTHPSQNQGVFLILALVSLLAHRFWKEGLPGTRLEAGRGLCRPLLSADPRGHQELALGHGGYGDGRWSHLEGGC